MTWHSAKRPPRHRDPSGSDLVLVIRGTGGFNLPALAWHTEAGWLQQVWNYDMPQDPITDVTHWHPLPPDPGTRKAKGKKR